jgi:threonyl-tRNA synthetase
MGVMIEHFAGAFPLWLSPVQVSVIPISEKHLDYAKKVKQELAENNVRVELYDENETLGKKIRGAEVQKIPYILIIGDKEVEVKSVSIRERSKGDSGVLAFEKFIEKVKEEIQLKK